MCQTEIPDPIRYLEVVREVTRRFSLPSERRESSFHFPGSHITKFRSVTRFALLFILVTLAPILADEMVPRVIACCITPGGYYSLTSVPSSTQEGNMVNLVLTVTGATGGTLYQFRFFVKDSSSVTFKSPLENYTTPTGQTQFSKSVAYPSTSFAGSDSLLGQYTASVDLVSPFASPNVASSSFFINIVDSSEHERTQTVNIQASGYNASESVSLSIRTQTTSTLVFAQTTTASPGGVVTADWNIPVNATIDTYVVTVSGTSTFKTPPDVQHFGVNVAIMSVAAILSFKPIYQRTETMQYSFQPIYPDGSLPSTGVGLLTLATPSGSRTTLTATYDGSTQTFNASYVTTMTNQTGVWTVTLGARAYSDAYGNTGPGTNIMNAPQLAPAALTIDVTTNTNIAVGQQLKFNATVEYPDGTTLQSGTVRAYLLYSGTPTINDSVPLVFDTTLGLWVGSYTARSTDSGGLWSLVVKASDSPTPANTGTATRAITIQNTPPASFPLYYFGFIATVIAGILIAVFLVFKKHRVTHARLKIDLEAVHSEAGRIESSEFFKSVKDQVRKEKEE
ncbi:MAG: hypothetical protein AUI95_03805 [Crenarchaeota archaeon 13_1_40CM_3_52_4]|nr:MAG: hypothetical protein AUI95_03805 [Crenarchaeota archaeon 13_1_40CM_3_52_4]